MDSSGGHYAANRLVAMTWNYTKGQSCALPFLCYLHYMQTCKHAMSEKKKTRRKPPNVSNGYSCSTTTTSHFSYPVWPFLARRCLPIAGEVFAHRAGSCPRAQPSSVSPPPPTPGPGAAAGLCWRPRWTPAEDSQHTNHVQVLCEHRLTQCSRDPQRTALLSPTVCT